MRARILGAIFFGARFCAEAQDATFAQITDPHLFDAGRNVHHLNVYEEALDNRAALHWAILEINRIVAEGKHLDFVVVTGDWGLENVRLSSDPQHPVPCKCPSPQEREGPIEPVSLDSATSEVKREFDALVVPRIFLLPGDADLCNGEIRDLHRYAEFIQDLANKLPHRIFDLTHTVETDASRENPRDVVNGFRIVGLNSAGFGKIFLGDSKLPGAPTSEFARLNKILPGDDSNSGSFLVFTHIPDLLDLDTKRPLWKVEDANLKVWSSIALRNQVLGIFAGHVHSSDRTLYARPGAASWSSRPAVASKTFIAPPLTIRGQNAAPRLINLPPPAGRTARGFLLATVTFSGVFSVQPFWYVPLDQKAASDGDAILAQAHAAAEDQQWDEAANKFASAMTSTDSRVRATATQGFEAARSEMRTWWWQLGGPVPPVRWVHAHPWRWGTILAALLALLVMKVTVTERINSRLARRERGILVPRFKGNAYLPAPTNLTDDAKITLFALHLSKRTDEVKALLGDSGVRSVVAGPLSLFRLPSQFSASLGNAFPTVKGVDVNKLLAFFVMLTRYFGWRVETYLAYCPDPLGQQGAGEMQAFAALRWAWLGRGTWSVKSRARNAFDVAEVAIDLAARILWFSLDSGTGSDAALHFTDENCFGHFIAGLRELRDYGYESEKDSPNRVLLRETLTRAYEDLNFCATHYPNDPAPLFSFGLVLTMMNQNVYAKALEDRAPTPIVDRELDLPSPRPWPLLNQAANLFERVMKLSPMLSRAAQLNLAHVYAKRDDDISGTSDLTRALKLLKELPEPPSVSKTSKYAFLDFFATGEHEEKRNCQPLDFQARILTHFVEARVAFRATSASILNVLETAHERMEAVRSALLQSQLSVPTQTELQADACTKLGYLSYEAALTLANPADNRARLLQQAQTELARALVLKPNWNPPQVYMAQVLQSQGKIRAASVYLKSVLGNGDPEKDSTP